MSETGSTTLGIKTFTQMLQDWASAAQGAANALLDFDVGSILRAIAEAQGGVGLWLQGAILQLLATTRLSTAVAAAGANNSVGPAVDSFVGDFKIDRLPAIVASGEVTFARYTPTNAATIAVGTLIQTADGTQTFEVVADPTQGAYNALQNAYIIPAGTASVAATVEALAGGGGGNISAGTLTVLQSGISGVDTVTNAAAFTNGVNAETNGALATRFANYLASLSKGTVPAIEYAVAAVQQNLQCTVVVQPLEAPQVLVTVDDGSGDIAEALVGAALAAVQAVIAAGISVSVLAAIKVTADVNMTIGVAAGFNASTVQGQVQTALTNYINGIGLGNPLSYFALPGVALAVPGVAG